MNISTSITFCVQAALVQWLRKSYLSSPPAATKPVKQAIKPSQARSTCTLKKIGMMGFAWRPLLVVLLLLCLHLAGGQVEQAGAPVERIVLTTIFGKVRKAANIQAVQSGSSA